MNYREKTKKLNYLLEKIQKGNCTSLDIIANGFNCSKRTVARMINDLKEDGYNIKFCKSQNKYFVENNK
jgi:predicted DNA-binding transcriptional regulator YafY